MSTATISIQYPVTQVSVKIANYTGGLVKPSAYLPLFHADGTADVTVTDQYVIYDLADPVQDMQFYLPAPSEAIKGQRVIIINHTSIEGPYHYWFSAIVYYPSGAAMEQQVPAYMSHTLVCTGSAWVIVAAF